MNPDYKTHLNKYPTIYIDWNRFADIPKNEILKEAQKCFVADLKKSYPFLQEQESFSKALAEINQKTGDRFILIIDEWDMLVRDVDQDIQDEYVNFLRAMFKSNNAKKIFLLVYMTGILPIIKIRTQSALNNFVEYSIVNPGITDKYYGFTEDEVKKLCAENDMDFELMKHAYDGYIIGREKSMFNEDGIFYGYRNLPPHRRRQCKVKDYRYDERRECHSESVEFPQRYEEYRQLRRRANPSRPPRIPFVQS